MEVSSDIHMKVKNCKSSDNSGSQTFKLTKNGQVLLKHVDGNCLDVYRSDTSPGTIVQSYPCTNNPNQVWTFDDVTHHIVSGLSAGSHMYCLDIQLDSSSSNNSTPSVSSGSSLVLNPCDSTSFTQKWQLNINAQE